jgi:hypothetical protein
LLFVFICCRRVDEREKKINVHEINTLD